VSKESSLRAFRHRNYRILFPANALSNIGTWAQRIAQDWLVLELTGSAQLLGIITALQFLPSLLFSLYGGVLADRFDKRSLLVITNIGAGMGSVILGLLVITDLVQVWHVALLAFMVGVFSALDAPVRTSFNSELVGQKDIPSAISLNSANFNAGRLIGPAASGFLIVLFGTGLSFIINSFTYLAVVISLLMLRKQDLFITQKPQRGAKIKAAIDYVRGNRQILLVMIAVFFATTFGFNFQIFMAVMATKEFGKGAAEFGILGSVLAIGSFTGVLISAKLEHLRVPKFVMKFGIGFGSLLVVTAWMPTYGSFAAILPLVGGVALMMMISANSYIQTNCEPSLRGRVMGIYLLIFMGGTPLGAPAIGWFAEVFGVRWAVFICGLIVAVSAAIILVVLKRTPGPEPKTESLPVITDPQN
jgi:MFS family permease